MLGGSGGGGGRGARGVVPAGDRRLQRVPKWAGRERWPLAASLDIHHRSMTDALRRSDRSVPFDRAGPLRRRSRGRGQPASAPTGLAGACLAPARQRTRPLQPPAQDSASSRGRHNANL